jgi:hypothetical protein
MDNLNAVGAIGVELAGVSLSSPIITLRRITAAQVAGLHQIFEKQVAPTVRPGVAGKRSSSRKQLSLAFSFAQIFLALYFFIRTYISQRRESGKRGGRSISISASSAAVWHSA